LKISKLGLTSKTIGEMRCTTFIIWRWSREKKSTGAWN